MSNRNDIKRLKTDRHAVIKNAGGFSLIELIIAMAILAFGMLAAASMQYSAIKNNTNGNIYTQANMLAKAKLEYLKNLDIDSAELMAKVDPYSDPTLINETEHAGGIYWRQWWIQDLGTQARTITVRVEWTRLGDTRSVVVVSNTRGSGV